MNSSIVRDLGLLIARIGLGIIFIAHGWQKFFTYKIAGTQASFEAMGAPLPKVSAIAAATIELGGGILLIAGVLTPLVGVLLFLDMVGAFFIVHSGNGVFVDAGGYELVLALGVGSLLIAAIGAGRISVDGLIGKGDGWLKTAA
ncbi:DoxX family protein [Rhodococcus sp. KBS0724]|jgi:putative oxidoreductase|uniref:DoxX family protein n=1 Tax=Rhodococcus sp. KBS0724 TaxID=1179674 RepID=UPI00110F4046|nr:DoxX family protein [Rhodococcus sp. KBS0724]TSD45981.1 DoxX family protein [Rhodococcus sp. KBS0724]